MLAARFQFGRECPTEIGLDLRPAERSEVVSTRRNAISASEHAAVLFELLRAVKRQEQLVGKPKRQSRGSLCFHRQRWREDKLLVREEGSRHRDNGLISRDDAPGCFYSNTFSAVVDPLHRTVEGKRQIRAV